jgi:hypothetical protein
MLMSPDHARVDADHPLDLADRVIFDDHIVQDAIPDAVRSHNRSRSCAVFHGLPFRQVTP